MSYSPIVRINIKLLPFNVIFNSKVMHNTSFEMYWTIRFKFNSLCYHYIDTGKCNKIYVIKRY